MKFLVLSLFFFSQILYAQVEREEIEVAFVLKFIPFIKNAKDSGPTYNICVLKDQKIFSYLSSSLKNKDYKGATYALYDGDSVDQKHHCQIVITGEDCQPNELNRFLPSLHITKNKQLFDKAIIHLKITSGRLRFDINNHFAVDHGYKIDPKLLQIADYVEK